MLFNAHRRLHKRFILPLTALILATATLMTFTTFTYSKSLNDSLDHSGEEISALEYDQLAILMKEQSTNQLLLKAVSDAMATHKLITKSDFKKIQALKKEKVVYTKVDYDKQLSEIYTPDIESPSSTPESND